jgi:voltage-gated potassium channel
MPDSQTSIARRRLLQPRVRAREELRLIRRRLLFLLILLSVLVIGGSVGFMLTERSSLAWGFVRTLDTLTTEGSIAFPRDTAGRVVKVALMLFGIGTLFYAFATIAEFFVSGELSGVLDERRTQSVIDSYRDHYIVCGFGRVGRQVSRDLRAARVDYVVVDSNPDNREIAQALGVRYVEDEPADDQVLLQAGIQRARGLIACVDSDAENIFITLTARELRSDILIIARASKEDSEKKLVRAGADRVISPYKTSGSEMARVALHPQVGGAVQFADYRMEEIEVSPGCSGAGKTIDAVRGASMIVVLRHHDGRFEAQPSPETVIEAGDRLVAIGPPDALERLEELFEPASVATA